MQHELHKPRGTENRTTSLDPAYEMPSPKTVGVVGSFVATVVGVIVSIALQTGIPYLPVATSALGFAIGYAYQRRTIAQAREEAEEKDRAKRGFAADDAEREDLIEHSTEYPHVGEYILTSITDLRSPEGETGVDIIIDLPDGEHSWSYDFPHLWDTEENTFANIADTYGYGPETFDNLVGEPVFVELDRSKYDTTRTLLIADPRETVEHLIEDNELTEDDVQVRAIEAELDISISLDPNVQGDEIVVEELPDDLMPYDEDDYR